MMITLKLLRRTVSRAATRSLVHPTFNIPLLTTPQSSSFSLTTSQPQSFIVKPLRPVTEGTIGRSVNQLTSSYPCQNGQRLAFSTAAAALSSDASSRLCRTDICHVHPKNWTTSRSISHQQFTVVKSAVRDFQSMSRRSEVDVNDVSSPKTVVMTSLNESRRLLDIKWNDGETTSYPYVWLRDCCQCGECFHDITTSRRLLFDKLDLNVHPVQVQMDSGSQEVVITWSDEHRSVYRYGWLLERSFRTDHQSVRSRWNGRKPILWGAEIATNVPTISYDKLMTDEWSQYKWLTDLEEIGFVIVKDAPIEGGQILKIGELVAFNRRTAYGEITSVESKENPSNLAYTTGPLVLHNDLAYYDNVPGMQMMHCIKQSTGDGGDSLFVDGFQAAKQLHEEFPDQFKILTNTIIDFYNIGKDFIDFHQMARHPTIRLNEEGEVIQIAYSTHARDSFMRLTLDQVDQFYKALKTFTNLLYDPRNLMEIKLQPGDISCFDNWRVLHGRKGFNLYPGNSRLLEHGYIDWDEMHSKRRVLKVKLGISNRAY